MTLLAVLVGLLGWLSPATLPLCFQPEQADQIVVICPGRAVQRPIPAVPTGTAAQPQVDAVVRRTARPADIAVVEVIGLTAVLGLPSPPAGRSPVMKEFPGRPLSRAAVSAE